MFDRQLEQLMQLSLGIVGTIVMVIAIRAIFSKSSIPVLVLKSWSLTAAPTDPSGTYVRIVGRRQGIKSWLLALLGVDPTVVLEIDGRHVRHEQRSWGGLVKKVISISSLSSCELGVLRPWMAALVLAWILAVMLGAGGAAMGNSDSQLILILLGVAMGVGLAVVYYKLNKTIAISVNEGGAHTGIAFKRSVIEGSNIGEEDAQRVTTILETLIDARKL